MKDQFVTYEIAKKLKELGFNELCFASQVKYGTPVIISGLVSNETQSILPTFLAIPLWQQAIDWLRQEKGIDINLIGTGSIWTFNINAMNLNKSKHNLFFKEAREAAILKALELIEK